MSSPEHILCGGGLEYSQASKVRPAYHTRLGPKNLNQFIGFRTTLTAVTTVQVTMLCTLQIVRGGCRNSEYPEWVQVSSFASYIDSVGDHDTGFRCYIPGRRRISRT